ncbi:MAG: hypothetical protein RLZZ188_2073, partial [Verrucomicrobiota bacterium]
MLAPQPAPDLPEEFVAARFTEITDPHARAIASSARRTHGQHAAP